MSKFLIGLVFASFGVFVCYHYYPVATKKAAGVLMDKMGRAGNELTK